MAAQLLEIQPLELKFIFELKKQSSCTVQLTNTTNQHVAFKVKTTSPKKYSVRPNVGTILPKSTCEFIVTMQAQRSAPPDMICRDKFLIQSTMVPGVLTEESITAALFSRDEGKHVEEVKLRVVLVSPPRSPVLSPMSGTLPEDTYATMQKEPVLSKTPPYKAANELNQSSEELKLGKTVDLVPPMYMVINEESNNGKSAELKPMMYMSIDEKLSPEKEAEKKTTVNVFENMELNPADNADLKSKNYAADHDQLKPAHDEFLKPPNYVVDGKNINVTYHLADVKDLKSAVNSELKPSNDEVYSNNGINSEELKIGGDSNYCSLKDLDLKNYEEKLNTAKQLMKHVEELNIVRDIKEMKSKLYELELKLSKAEDTILQLKAERTLSIQERETLKEDLASLSSKAMSSKRVQVGFPPLFVLMVALVSLVVGYFSCA